MEFTRIVGLCVGTSILYGILHDQVTAHICVEYFTIGHPRIFPTESPTLLAVGWGIIATRWVGIFLGLILATTSRFGAQPKLTAAELRSPIAILLTVMAVTSFVAGIVGYGGARASVLTIAEPLRSRITPEGHDRFLANTFAHLAAYGTAGIGGISLAIRILIVRNRMASQTPEVPEQD